MTTHVQVIGFKLPSDLVRAIDSASNRELISRADWLRRAVFARLREESFTHTNAGRPIAMGTPKPAA